MHSVTVPVNFLTASDVSCILNLICPRCGGPLGGVSQEFKCQGVCRKDWRPDWESHAMSRSGNKTICRSKRRMAHSIR